MIDDRDQRHPDRWQKEWPALHQALDRTRAATTLAQSESARWPVLKELMRTAVKPRLLQWRRQMKILQQPISLLGLRRRHLQLYATYRFPGWHPAVVIKRLKIAFLYLQIVAWRLWNNRVIILRGMALAFGLLLTIAATWWFIANLDRMINAIRGIFP
jgi:hypothetical protein